jgi:GAF domain-containing protein
MDFDEQRLPGKVAGELQDLVLDSADVEEFLSDLAHYTSHELSRTDRPVICGITIMRHRKPATRAASSPEASAMDEIQNKAGDGPCHAAMRDLKTIYVPDLRREERWPELSHSAARHGYFSILGVPVRLEDQTRAALNLYASGPASFTAADITLAENFADQASKSLRLALRIARLRDARDDLAAAMESRAVIDMAVGVVMAQNRCAPEEAFALLRSASNSRNTKLREVAASIVTSISGQADVKAHFEE